MNAHDGVVSRPDTAGESAPVRQGLTESLKAENTRKTPHGIQGGGLHKV